LEATVSEEQAAVVTGWVDAHNDRDLGGMLARMSPGVVFHPLRLTGVKGPYHGHDGVRQWFDQMLADEHEHRLELTELRDAGKNRIVAFGHLRLGRQSDPAPFWALDRFSDGLIIETNNYLTDPAILEHGRLFDL
jgi:ketosteroid isomerase-like protein